MDIPNSFIYLGIFKVPHTQILYYHWLKYTPLYITDQRAIADLEEHRIIQAAKIKEHTVPHTTPTPFVTQLPFTTPFNPTPAPFHSVSHHFSTPAPFLPTPHPYPKPTPHNALLPYSKPTPHNTLYPKPTPIKPYPTPHPLSHSPKPTPIKPYPTPHTLPPYPKPTPIKPYPKPINPKPFKPNSILPPYDTPSTLPIRFPNRVHGTPKPHFEPNHFIFPKERSLARPLPLERAKNQRGFAHDFFSTPRKTSLVRGYYFEQ